MKKGTFLAFLSKIGWGKLSTFTKKDKKKRRTFGKQYTIPGFTLKEWKRKKVRLAIVKHSRQMNRK